MTDPETELKAMRLGAWFVTLTVLVLIVLEVIQWLRY